MSNPFFINQNFGSQYGRRIQDAPPYPTFDKQGRRASDSDSTVKQRVVQSIPVSAVDCGWILVDHIVFDTAELDALLDSGSLEALLREALSLRLQWRFTGREDFTEERGIIFRSPVPSITTLQRSSS